jgi:hypothetical protein
MRRPAVPKTKQRVGSTVMVYVAGVKGKVALTVPVASPAAIRKTLNLSATSKRRVERAIAQVGLRRKTG